MRANRQRGVRDQGRDDPVAPAPEAVGERAGGSRGEHRAHHVDRHEERGEQLRDAEALVHQRAQHRDGQRHGQQHQQRQRAEQREAGARIDGRDGRRRACPASASRLLARSRRGVLSPRRCEAAEPQRAGRACELLSSAPHAKRAARVVRGGRWPSPPRTRSPPATLARIDPAAARAGDLARGHAPEAGGRGAGDRASPPAAPTAPIQAPAPVAAPVAGPAPARLRDRLRRTRDALVGRLSQLAEGRRLDAALLEELEQLLFGADLGVKTAESLLASGARAGRGRAIPSRCAACCAPRSSRSCERVQGPTGLVLRGKPHVILVLGVNGSGKTTTHRQARRALPRRGSPGDPGRGRHLPGGRHRPAPDLGRADRLRGDRGGPGQRSVGGGLRHAQGGAGEGRRRRDHRHRRTSPDQAPVDGGARQAHGG